ncbi:hypothetical protein LC593_30170 [Nostoc sp. CHAB 5844]|nr:hypothetical protein [Nostoc sp. CHAB 5844]
MNEIQSLETWNDWDEINLSTAELRQQRLEILLCQKLKNGEDVTQCLQVLEYLKNSTTEQKLTDIFFQRVRNRLRLEFLQKASFIGMAVIVAMTCFITASRLANFSTPNNSLPTLSSKKHQSVKPLHKPVKHESNR